MKLVAFFRKYGYSLFFVGIFLVTLQGVIDFDIWFHIKSGEIIATHGLIRYDVFSHAAAGREWYPYEWLFQIVVYFLWRLAGAPGISVLVALLSTAHAWIITKILRAIFGLRTMLTAALSVFYIASVYEFLTPRPHLAAYLLLLITVYLILLFLVHGKNRLVWTVPIAWVWGNMHGSVFLGPMLFTAFAAITAIRAFHDRERTLMKRAGTLALFAVLFAVVTVLPPIGTTQYRLLYSFYQKLSFIQNFIDEWVPLSANRLGFTAYSITLVGTAVLLLWIVLRRQTKTLHLIVPFLPFLVLAYTASRNLPLAYMSLTFALGFGLTHISLRSRSRARFVWVGMLILFVSFHVWLITDKRTPPPVVYPEAAVDFITKQNLTGNMYNEYGYGGYLLFHLYPKQKVFIDGRTDVYLCCEMVELSDLTAKQALDDDQYGKALGQLLTRHAISFVLLSTDKHSVSRKMARILTDDPTWRLVYWDDHFQIIVKDDGKNNAVIREFGATAATPYHKEPYRTGQEKQAMTEYRRMVTVTDSAKSQNAIGFLLLSQKRFEEAKTAFERAISLNPRNESPFMNLAEMAAAYGDGTTAIRLYENARKLAPDRGLIYIRLGEIYQRAGDAAKARAVWTQGLEKTVDTEATSKLKALLEQ